MRQSNFYIILFAVILTIVCGSLLSLASKGLEDYQKANVRNENITNILKTTGMDMKGVNVPEMFKERVEPVVINYDGKVLENMNPQQIDLVKQYKKPQEERTLPVYKIKKEGSDETEYFVFPVHGFGLWDRIWGYVCLKSDLNTIQGVVFDHKSETKGLGARIADDPKIRNGFEGKKVFEEKSVELQMMKGELGNDAYEDNLYKVDGMSGATLTGNGVSNMFEDYFAFYKSYIFQNKDGGKNLSLVN